MKTFYLYASNSGTSNTNISNSSTVVDVTALTNAFTALSAALQALQSNTQSNTNTNTNTNTSSNTAQQIQDELNTMRTELSSIAQQISLLVASNANNSTVLNQQIKNFLIALLGTTQNLQAQFSTIKTASNTQVTDIASTKDQKVRDLSQQIDYLQTQEQTINSNMSSLSTSIDQIVTLISNTTTNFVNTFGNGTSNGS